MVKWTVMVVVALIIYVFGFWLSCVLVRIGMNWKEKLFEKKADLSTESTIRVLWAWPITFPILVILFVGNLMYLSGKTILNHKD